VNSAFSPPCRKPPQDLSAKLLWRAPCFTTALALCRHRHSFLAPHTFTLLVFGFFFPEQRSTSTLEDTERGLRAVRGVCFYRPPLDLECLLVGMWRKSAWDVNQSRTVATSWPRNVLDICPRKRAKFARQRGTQNPTTGLERLDGVCVLCNLRASNGIARISRKRQR